MINLIQNFFHDRALNKNKRHPPKKDCFQNLSTSGVIAHIVLLEKRHEQLTPTTLSLGSRLPHHSGFMEIDLPKYIEKADLLDSKKVKRVYIKGKIQRNHCTHEFLRSFLACPHVGNKIKGHNEFSGT